MPTYLNWRNLRRSVEVLSIKALFVLHVICLSFCLHHGFATSADKYALIPSLWVTLTTFVGAYIVINAANIYTTNPSAKPKDSTPVQQRKGMGLISMLAAVLLLVVLLLGRYFTGCEFQLSGPAGSAVGFFSFLLSIGIGAGMAFGWWHMLAASGTSNSDIHGVMAGLTPGGLSAGAMACRMT